MQYTLFCLCYIYDVVISLLALSFTQMCLYGLMLWHQHTSEK